MTKDIEFCIIESLYPSFTEYADNAKFFYWMDYACELDEIMNIAYIDTKLTDYLSDRIIKLRAGSAEHDACVDVASTFEESIPDQYKGVFTYE